MLTYFFEVNVRYSSKNKMRKMFFFQDQRDKGLPDVRPQGQKSLIVDPVDRDSHCRGTVLESTPAGFVPREHEPYCDTHRGNTQSGNLWSCLEITIIILYLSNYLLISFPYISKFL